MMERVQSVTYLVRLARVQEEINVLLVHLIGDWQPVNAGQNVLKTFFLGKTAVDAVIIIARTVMGRGPSAVKLAPHILH